MYKILILRLYYSLWLLPLHTASAQQDVPAIACPNYFQYYTYNHQAFGKLTLPNLSPYEFNLEIGFSQREPVLNDYFGSISLFDDKETTNNNLINRIPISFRVDFPIPTVLPKLTKISVDNQLLCQASDDAFPSTSFSLPFTFMSRTKPFQNFEPVPLKIIHSTSTSNSSTAAVLRDPFLQPHLISDQSLQPKTISNDDCGRERYADLTPFIYNGRTYSRGQYPWLAAIYKKSPGQLRFLCGGSLVSARSVISAAHCFDVDGTKPSEIVIYLGRHNLDDYSEEAALVREVQTLYTHPDFNEDVFSDADIAILRLKTKVEFNQYISPVCLWSEPSDTSLIVGQTGLIIGWGADESGGDLKSVPKFTNANIVSEIDCRRSSPVLSRITSSRTLCAGNQDDSGPCTGDSGGGLMLNRNGRWTLRAVLSAGRTVKSRCDTRTYAVYCDLAKHLDWVKQYV